MRARPILLLATASLACAFGEQMATRAGAPFTATTATIERVVERGEYLDATVRLAPDLELRFLLPNAGKCQAVAKPKASVQYRRLDRFGSLETPAGSCYPVGLLSIPEWMERVYRPQLSPRPRQRSDFKVVRSDADFTFLRGNFELATTALHVGVGRDLVALVARDQACDAALARGSAQLEFKERAEFPFELYMGETRCRMVGFAQPPGPKGWREQDHD